MSLYYNTGRWMTGRPGQGQLVRSIGLHSLIDLPRRLGMNLQKCQVFHLPDLEHFKTGCSHGGRFPLLSKVVGVSQLHGLSRVGGGGGRLFLGYYLWKLGTWQELACSFQI